MKTNKTNKPEDIQPGSNEDKPENGINNKAIKLDEDIRNDIEHTEVIPHVKKRHPLNSDRSDEDVEWKEKEEEESDYEKQNDDDDNFAGGL